MLYFIEQKYDNNDDAILISLLNSLGSSSYHNTESTLPLIKNRNKESMKGLHIKDIPLYRNISNIALNMAAATILIVEYMYMYMYITSTHN